MVPNVPPPHLPPLPPPPRHHHHHHHHNNNNTPPSTTARPPTRSYPTPYFTPSPTIPTFFKPKLPAQTPDHSSPAAAAIILHDPRYRTHPAIWCGAFVCLAFSLLLILAGFTTLAAFLIIRPRLPSFDVPSANLTAVSISSPYLNGDFSFVANFTNPNNRLDLEFKYAELQLVFEGRVLADQRVKGTFELRRRGGRMVGVVYFDSRLVYLPLEVAMELQRKVASNKVEYEVRGRFRVRAKVARGLGYSYWLRSRCLLQLTAPPAGVLVARSCSTRR